MHLIIFDCDGVLIDSETISAQGYCNVYARYGQTIEPKDFYPFIGMKQLDIIKTLRGKEGGTIPLSADDELSEEVLRLLKESVKATPNIVPFLQNLAKPYCVASSSAMPRIRLSLTTAGLINFFEPHLFSSSMVKHGKPAPDLFLLAAEKMGASPSECLVFEDSIAGITAAVAAKMTAIGYIGAGHMPQGHEQRLIEAGATKVIADWSEADAIIKEFRG